MKLAAGFFILIISINFALGLGIAPARHEIAVPETIIYRVYNTEGIKMTVHLEANGSLPVELSTETLVFRKSDKFLTFTAKITEAKGTNAEITLDDGKKEIKAIITKTGKTAPVPTGNVTEKGDSTSFLPIIILGIIASANATYFLLKKGNKTPRTAKELLEYVQKLSDEQFNSMVDEDNNEIADFLKKKEPELAFRLYETVDRHHMVSVIEKYLKENETRDSEALKSEITELKHELDTFEFSGYEQTSKVK